MNETNEQRRFISERHVRKSYGVLVRACKTQTPQHSRVHSVQIVCANNWQAHANVDEPWRDNADDAGGDPRVWTVATMRRFQVHTKKTTNMYSTLCVCMRVFCVSQVFFYRSNLNVASSKLLLSSDLTDPWIPFRWVSTGTSQPAIITYLSARRNGGDSEDFRDAQND